MTLHGALVRTVLACALVAAVMTGPARPAGASCVGPEVTVSPEVLGPTATLTVEGEYFGTDCYDTGTPPGHEDEGGLGPPATDIEVIFQQGERRIVVARGDADSTYHFEVDVAVPAGLHQGAVTIVATLTVSGDSRDVVVRSPLTISAPTSAGGSAEVRRFGPVASATPAAESRADRGRGPLYTAVGAISLAAVATLVWRLRRTRWSVDLVD
ncbi:hypothetical protein BH10ACT1_BH10ACT1_06240 [soil metagenome]